MANYDSTVSTTATLLSDRLGDGHDYSPTSCDARAVSKTHCAFLTWDALTARTKQYGLASCSMVRRTSSVDTRLVATRPAHVLAFVARDGQPGMQTPCAI